MKYKNMEELYKVYDKLQKKYGDKNLDSIYNGGCTNNPDICFVFMNPTMRNIAAEKSWEGPKHPWIGTKNIWTLFYNLGLLDKELFDSIREKKGKDWDYDFANLVYDNVKKHKFFITNLGKCTQVDARPLDDAVFLEYKKYLEYEFNLIKPKVIILFGNQVSSIMLGEKISVSQVRKNKFVREINGEEFSFYSVYYPVGNGFFNIDKAIEDIKWIQAQL
ncbi:MAG: hypothetical protein OSJ65_05335 [Bacilli bacterium]|nr:hypothetical protein [Bacilli bacterium]